MGHPPDHPCWKTGSPKSFLGCPNYFDFSLKVIYFLVINTATLILLFRISNYIYQNTVACNYLPMLQIMLCTQFVRCSLITNFWSYIVVWIIVIIPPASTKLKGGYTGITLSVCPSVDRMVSALYLQEYSSDPFHICTSYQATSESVTCNARSKI